MHEIQASSPFIPLIFFATYTALAFGQIPGLRIDRVGIVIVGMAAMLVADYQSADEALQSTNWNTIALLFSLMMISGQLTQGDLLQRVAHRLFQRRWQPPLLLLVVMGLIAGFAAFITNEVAVLLFTPLIIQQLQPLGYRLLPFLLGTAMAANIGSASTLVGNPQIMVVAGRFPIHFATYSLWAILPVLLALFLTWGVILLFYRNLTVDTLVSSIYSQSKTELLPLSAPANREAIKGLVVLAILIVLFLTPIPRSISALAIAGLLLLNRYYSTKDILKNVDWGTLVLIIGLGVIVHYFTLTGMPTQWLDDLNRSGLNPHNPFLLTLVTAILSVGVNNIPAVMLLISTLGTGSILDGEILAVASSFAGNFLMIASVANFIMVQQAEAQGINVSFKDHAKIGIPSTILSLGVLMGWLWLQHLD
jgi:Na+/H+ antiporter NhaD/arsenite permease-like protein